MQDKKVEIVRLLMTAIELYRVAFEIQFYVPQD